MHPLPGGANIGRYKIKPTGVGSRIVNRKMKCATQQAMIVVQKLGT